ncbi:MAG: magnesium-translocating P-type ATPase [Candidatus Nomurabacteria bacterium]|nr:magnesium-translocating P-type ATPase [Candidatus Nomurabacteria bacterium]
MFNTKRTDVINGLSSLEAQKYLAKFGENTIYHHKKLRPFVMFLKKFNNPLLYLLMGAAIVAFFFGQAVNAVILIVMIFVSVTLDFFNSYKSEKVAEKLVEKVASTATVRRDGAKKEIPFHRLVPGDILELSAGDVIPADCIVISADDFFVNQSALTGESFPIEKNVFDSNVSIENISLKLTDTSSVFMGTSVVTGFAIAEVVQTGSGAEFGKIAERLSAIKQETSFEISLKDFSIFILRLTLVMVIIVFIVNAFYGRGVLNSFLFAAAIAVGLTPELLPVIMTVTLSHGSLRMAKKQVILKNLASVQNFGSMDILCTDKTGTLTEDKIELIKCVNISGIDSKNALLYSYLNSIFHTARKSPLDEAIQIHGKMDSSIYIKIDEIPFDFERKRDSVVVDHGGDRLLVTKGAPENILAITKSWENGGNIFEFNDEVRKLAQDEYDRLSSDGFRVLAVAIKKIEKDERIKYKKQEEEEMTFVGFAAFLDPPKTSASSALEELKNLSIEVKIITGDSEILTERICKDLNIEIKGSLTGAMLDKLSDEELTQKLDATNIFARVSPEQKERIVKLLQKAGHTVGYMGDGINDAPVLKISDVGISVNNAVDVAKETADIILLNKNLHVLKDGVIEGRSTFQNTLKYIKMGFSSNFGNMFSMMGASFFLPFFPMLSSQIIFNNFLYDLSQTTIPTDSTDVESVKNPLKWNMKEFYKYIIVFGLISSIFDFITFFVLYKVFNLNAQQFQTGWFIESIATQILVIFVIRTKRSPFWKSTPGMLVTVSTIAVVAFAWIVPFTPLGALLSFDPLPFKILALISCIVAGYLVIAEISKYFFYRTFVKAP